MLVYRDQSGEWRWKRLAGNNKVVADSGEGYRRRWSAKRAAKRNNVGVELVVAS